MSLAARKARTDLYEAYALLTDRFPEETFHKI
jgi:hypothetical protein